MHDMRWSVKIIHLNHKGSRDSWFPLVVSSVLSPLVSCLCISVSAFWGGSSAFCVNICTFVLVKQVNWVPLSTPGLANASESQPRGPLQFLILKKKEIHRQIHCSTSSVEFSLFKRCFLDFFLAGGDSHQRFAHTWWCPRSEIPAGSAFCVSICPVVPVKQRAQSCSHILHVSEEDDGPTDKALRSDK